VEAVNALSHIAGIRTIAECVESREILRRLIAMKVDYAQGGRSRWIRFSPPALLEAGSDSFSLPRLQIDR